ncbi:MAG TPA: hypothetical protein VIL13_05015 [Longimicrobiales bacterium]
METRAAFCSACDRNVPVILVHPSRHNRERDAEQEIVCLDYGVRCTGALCPVMYTLPDERALDPHRQGRIDPSWFAG